MRVHHVQFRSNLLVQGIMSAVISIIKANDTGICSRTLVFGSTVVTDLFGNWDPTSTDDGSQEDNARSNEPGGNAMEQSPEHIHEKSVR